MALLTVVGGLTVAFAVFTWAAVKLVLNDRTQSVGTVAAAFRAFLLMVAAHLFVPGLASGANSAIGFAAGWLL
jgi:hypothetical protein